MDIQANHTGRIAGFLVRWLKFNMIRIILDTTLSYTSSISFVRLSLLTMTNRNQMREVLLFVCLKMADETSLS